MPWDLLPLPRLSPGTALNTEQRAKIEARRSIRRRAVVPLRSDKGLVGSVVVTLNVFPPLGYPGLWKLSSPHTVSLQFE